jgi:hypothetical protein
MQIILTHTPLVLYWTAANTLQLQHVMAVHHLTSLTKVAEVFISTFATRFPGLDLLAEQAYRIENFQLEISYEVRASACNCSLHMKGFSHEVELGGIQ